MFVCARNSVDSVDPVQIGSIYHSFFDTCIFTLEGRAWWESLLKGYCPSEI